MSILAATSQVPWPLDRGGNIRSFYLLRELARTFPVRLVTGSFGSADIQPLLDAGIQVRAVPLREVPAARDFGNVARAAILSRPYVCYARHAHRRIRTAFIEEFAAAKPDVLYLDHLDSFQLFDAVAPTPTVLDMHNVYSSLVRRTGDERRGVVGAYLRREARLLGDVESRAVASANAVLAVSDSDRDHFLRLGGRNVHVVPNGVDCSRYIDLPLERVAGPPLMLYVGSLSWQPNIDAVRFLIGEILPQLRATMPASKVRVVGRGAPDDLLRMRDRPGVEILTDVDDVRPHLREASVLAVPLEAGGGSRLKILEAFAAGLPVVSTPVGAEGIDAEDGKHLLLASRAELSAAVTRITQDRELALALAVNARSLAQQQYDWTQIGARAASVVAALTGR